MSTDLNVIPSSALTEQEQADLTALFLRAFLL